MLLPGLRGPLRLAARLARGLAVWALAIFLSALSLPAWLAPPAGAQEEPPPTPTILSTGVASLELEGRRHRVPYSVTPEGALFAVEAVAAALGGRVDVGPLGQSHVLVLQEARAIFGAGSPSLVVGESIVHLTPAPLAGEGGIQVPLAALERTFGDVLGCRFRWDPARRLLEVSREAPREVAVAIEVVHLQGVTTLVLRFASQPYYDLRRSPGAVEIEATGVRLAATEPRPLPGDSLVRRVQVRDRTIRIELAPGAEAESYALADPFRLVFDVHRPAGAGGGREAPPLPADRGALRTIVLDPGHGGAETGALGASGVTEKELTLLLARALELRLAERLGVRVVLTRDDDQQLALLARTEIANQHQADLFISLHLNSTLGSRARGAETYFLSLEASDQRAAALAAAENRHAEEPPSEAAGEANPDPLHDLRLLLWDLAQSYHLAESQRLANLIQEELNRALDLRDRGVKQAPFAVLRGAAMPAVLVELGFINDPEEEVKLQSPVYRDQLVEALARAIERFRAGLPEATPAAAEAGP